MLLKRFFLSATVLSTCAALLFLTSCSSHGTVSGTATGGTPPASQWVVSWGATPESGNQTAENYGGAECTFRFFFYPTVAGTTERLHFSNYYGTTPITIGAVRLAVAGATGTAVDPTHDAAVTFNGSNSVTIAPGTSVVSDNVSVTYTFGQKMAVSMYLPGPFPALTQHESQVNTNFVTDANAGNTTTDATGATFTNPGTEWFLLSGMDVYGPYQGTVALFGSSTIDGHASNYGDTNAYPMPNTPIPSQDNDRPSDFLARQLNAAGYHLGVLNAGILGDPAGPSSPAGTAGVDRIGRDVLTQPGIKAVIIYLGSVDLRGTSCGEATEVEASLTNMVSQAKAAGVRVILATVPPASYCTAAGLPHSGPFPSPSAPFAGDLNPGPENPGNAQRHLLNTWIKTSGAQLPGVYGVADFESALADPDHPDFLMPNLNSGDNFHPNGTGYGVQSSTIPIGSLLPQ